MRYVTELMSKFFSDSISAEFKDLISEKVNEAMENGTSTFSYDGIQYNLVENGDNAIIEDTAFNELTAAYSDGDKNITMETVSATQPNVQVPRAEGEDGKHLPEGSSQPDAEVKIETGIVDAEKAGIGKHFSAVISGFETAEDAEAALDLLDNSLTFSDVELENIADNVTSLMADTERLMGTGDMQLAFSILDSCEQLKAYSILAENYGHDLGDVIEAVESFSEIAEESINDSISNMPVTEFFSELDQDEIDAYFSEVDEATAIAIHEALDDETMTFSDVDELAVQIDNEMQLQTPMTEMFSDMSEEEFDAFFSDMSTAEINVINNVLDENPNATFSDVNEVLEQINIPIDAMFSNMSDEELDAFQAEFSDAFDAAVDMALDEEVTFTFSDFLSYVNDIRTFTDADLENLAANMNELQRAYSDMMEKDDPELAKQVKCLAEGNLEDAEKAEAAGHDVEAVKSECSKYSEDAAKKLDDAGEGSGDGEGKADPKPAKDPEPAKADPEPAKEGDGEEEPKKETKEECDSKSFSKTYMRPENGTQRVFSQSLKTDGKVSSVNPYLRTSFK